MSHYILDGMLKIGSFRSASPEMNCMHILKDVIINDSYMKISSGLSKQINIMYNNTIIFGYIAKNGALWSGAGYCSMDNALFVRSGVKDEN